MAITLNRIRLSTDTDAFGLVWSFVGPQDLARAEGVCRDWNRFIRLTDQWKRQCQIQLGLSSKIDPQRYLPESPSYKASFQRVLSKIYGVSTYEFYLGAKVEPPPQIPEAISLKRWDEPDPCDRTTTIGAKYVWIYYPAYVEIPDRGDFFLDKPDDPQDPEAPRLIRKKAGLIEKLTRIIGIRDTPENKILRVPMTLYNIAQLFKNPQKGTPSTFEHISPNILEQHGNKRIPAGWVCMRRNVVGRDLSFFQQKAFAAKRRVIIASLSQRIFFNFLENTSSGAYADSRYRRPNTCVRTSTLTDGFPSGCGFGSRFGLRVAITCNSLSYEHIGTAVVLSTEADKSP